MSRLPIAIALAALVMAAPAHAAELHCGSTITADTTLRHDLRGCPGDGILIGTDGITLRLSGHTISGTGHGVGIRDNGHDGVTITGGAVDGFSVDTKVAEADGVTIAGTVLTGSTGDQALLVLGQHNDVLGNLISHNSGGAISLDSGGANRVEHNLIADNGDGITFPTAGNLIAFNTILRTGFFGDPDTGGFGVLLDGADHNTVTHNLIADGRGPAIFVTSFESPDPAQGNTIVGNVANSRLDDGIHVDTFGADTLIASNTANRSGRNGIEVESPMTTLTGNTANGNALLGIDAAPGVTDGGGNRAAGNGDPAQCANISC
jgi:parallel beta-helix repeat protein